MNIDVMSSLLGSQMNDLSLKDAQNRPKQFGNDSNPINQMNRQSQNPFSSYSSPSPVINNWSGLSLGDNLGLDQPAIDDGVIPFVPGKIWAGTGPSVEDDPNCTPGSVSRPLLTGAIDPESILGSLQRNGQWNNNLPNSLNSSMGSHLGNQLGSAANNNTNRQGRNNSGAWPSNSNNYMSQMSLPTSSNNNANNSGSIGEQLWGVRGGNNGINRMGNNNPLNNQQNSNSLLNNRNSSMINTNNVNNSLLNQQQQQFFRSNSWNMNSQQSPMNLDNRNPSMSNNNNFNLNNGHFILIRNVTPQVSN
jgi:hypothetical protein